MTKKDSNLIKGIAIIAMLIHHLFYDAEVIEKYKLEFWIGNADVWLRLSNVLKICVSIFVFISAYGISKQLSDDHITKNAVLARKTTFRICKLELNFLFVFLLCQLFGLFGRSQFEVYGPAGGRSCLYFILDALGMAKAFGSPTMNATWWYMPFAIFAIAIIPMLYKITAQIGGMAILAIAVIFPSLLSLDRNAILITYSLPMILGIIFAHKQLFEKLNTSIRRKYQKLIWTLFALAGMFICTKIRLNIGELTWLNNGFFVLFICIFAFVFLKKIPVISVILEFLGRHSMNIFFVHTFIYYYCFPDIYLLRHPFLIIFALCGITLGLSMLIEFLKEKTGYNKLVDKIFNVIVGKN